jgi:hypothetical protein
MEQVQMVALFTKGMMDISDVTIKSLARSRIICFTICKC